MTGRNDPCPCGSGKKYKKCCLRKDMQQTADRRQETPATGAPLTVPAPEPGTLVERMNAWWENFDSASYDEKWDLAEEALRDEPELMDREMVFEVGNALVDPAIERGEFERFERLIDSFQKWAPEAYERELTYMLHWRFTAAVARKDWPAVEEAFLAFSQIAGRDLDTYYLLVHALAYYGRLETLLQGMRQALPSVSVSAELVEWAAEDLAENLLTFELLSLLQEKPDLRVDDPELEQHMRAGELSFIPDRMEVILDYRTGRVEPAWEADELVLSFDASRDEEEWDIDGDEGDGEEPEREVDPARQKLSLLLMSWARYASLEEGVPMTKAEIACQELYEYLVQRSQGDLSDAPGGRRAQRTVEETLVPDRGTLDRFLGGMSSFFSAQYYKTCALFELIPLWLRFLKRYGLIDERAVSQALGNLQGLKGNMTTLAERALSDAQVVANLSAWPKVGGASSLQQE